MRKEAREIAFKLLYESFFNPDKIENSFLFLCEEAGITAEEDKNYIQSIQEIYEINKETIEKKIETNLVGYEKNRVFKVDLALMVLAITEIDYIKTPKAVVINEVIELAKTYSTEKSPSFVHGFLSSLYKET